MAVCHIQPNNHSSAFLFHTGDRSHEYSYKYICKPTSAVSVEAAFKAVGISVKAQPSIACKNAGAIRHDEGNASDCVPQALHDRQSWLWMWLALKNRTKREIAQPPRTFAIKGVPNSGC
jgi:hypothetical protein